MELRTPFTVLDGGLSTVLEADGFDLRHPLWTGRLITESPDALIDAHLAYLRAGAEIVITSSYQASIGGLVAMGLTRSEAEDALRATTTLAQQAVRRFGQPALVAASVGPYGATKADGSEYRGEYDVAAGELRRFHAERLRLLAEPAPDLLAIETIPTVFETRAIAEAVAEVGATPSWVAFVCRDGATTAGGDRIEDAVTAALEVPGIAAVGVNCTDPRLIGELLERAATEGAAVAADDPTLVGRWLAAGARIVGGCCGVGPRDIAGLRERRDLDIAAAQV